MCKLVRGHSFRLAIVFVMATRPAWGITTITPLGAADPSGVEIVAKFPAPRGTIKEIHLEVWAGPISAAGAAAELPAGLPVRSKTYYKEFVCKAAPELSTGSCSRKLKDVDPNLPKNTLVSVVAWYLAQGEEVYAGPIRDQAMQDSIGFAVGDPRMHKDLAWPLYWHEAYPLSERIDLAFTYPETLFLPVERVREVEKSAFDPKSNFAAVLVGKKNLFNLWLLAPVQSYDTALPCNFVLHGAANDASHFMDGIVLVHEEPVADCGFVVTGSGGNGRNGRGSVATRWSAAGMQLAPGAGLTLTHEMGHFLFEQSDEYEKMGGYAPKAACANVRLDEEECKDDLAKSGVASTKGACWELQGNGLNPRLWRSFLNGAGGKELMGLGPLAPVSAAVDWGATSTRCIEERFKGLTSVPAVAALRASAVPSKIGIADAKAIPEEPKVPKGKPGVIQELWTCKTGRGLWFARSQVVQAGFGVAALSSEICPESPETAEVSCEKLSGQVSPVRKPVWVAESRKRNAEEDQTQEQGRCWDVYEISDSGVKLSSQAGPCFPRIAVEGMGLIEEPIGFQVIASLELPPEVPGVSQIRSFCLSSPLAIEVRPPITIF
jgi:hypothetical protein